MKVKKETLLIIAAIVWFIAGFNILRIGLTSYVGYVNILNVFVSIIVFLAFWFMVFYKLTKKHTKRIRSYNENQFFLKFFDVKSFCIMAFMMSLGISIRAFSLMPNMCIAVFYTGLGSALSLTGILFGLNYYKLKRQ
ncbi:hypothetical protein ACTQYZ_10015 [Anaerofustis sp. LCP19S3_F7]|uniref:hypothetical protein n=1 Tax=Anaerofustis sp. LCP19S3_F7 TaxID=3440247 RepID=UPI003F90ECBE